MKVWPKNDTMRKVLRHPSAGGFREHGPADWPDDTFTHRLVRDGDLTTSDNTPSPAMQRSRKKTDTTDAE